MNRKDFLSSTSAWVAGSMLPGIVIPGSEPVDNLPVIPPYLGKGDVIGITSPAGFITLPEIQPAIQLIQSWGYKIKVGNTIGKRDFTFGGTDQERADDFQQMLDDRDIKAILCARGGYGSVRIVDQLKWERFRAHPKWIIGFSDITILHSHLNRNLGIASIHSKMCNSFPEVWNQADPIQADTILSIARAIGGTTMKYTAPFNNRNRLGNCEGVLVGGNLKTLESLNGTASDIKTDGKILFVEDTGEYMYSIDRMFWGLKRTGKLRDLAGLIVGGFKVKVDEGDDDFGRTLQDVVMEKVSGYKYPVCFDFPVGHQRNNFALKCGVKHKLSVKQEETILSELS